MRARLAKFAQICMIIVLASVSAGAPPALPEKYQRWLTGSASCLITNAEREAFLNLASDGERDAFIERFWEIRNPAPGTGQNEFKEEFYRRVAWVDAHYGRQAGTDGWRTDMGRTYILFGRPQTSMNYLGHQELRPIELWFYSNPGLPELPPFFYVLFYEKDDVSGYRFYHPAIDGPDKLLKAGGTKAQAYNYLRGISPELARASLSLVPGEPIDTESFSGSLGSAQIVNAIQGYREMPSYVALVSERARRLEWITSRIRYDIAQTSLIAFVSYQSGEPWVHWHLEIQDPMQPKARAGRVQYEIAARLYSNSRLVFERADSPGFTVSEALAEGLKRRPFIYEDRMPVAPGRYRLVVTARSAAAGPTYEASREFIAEAPGDRALLSDVLVVAKHEPDRRERPFQFGGVKFLPSASGQAQPARGLGVLYQVTAPEPRPAELEVEYVIGNPAAKFRKVFQEKLDLRQADSFGSIVTSKTLSIEELAPGSYQLALRIRHPQTGKITGRAAGFVVVNSAEEPPDPIVISRAGAQSPQWLAANYYERALCWLAQDRLSEALAALEESCKLSRNASVETLLRHLYERTGRQSSKPKVLIQKKGDSKGE